MEETCSKSCPNFIVGDGSPFEIAGKYISIAVAVDVAVFILSLTLHLVKLRQTFDETNTTE